jgi:hypothetical protein
MHHSHQSPVGSPLVRLALLLTAFSLPAVAQGQSVENHLYDKFEIVAAGTDVVISPSIQINGSNGEVGTDIEFGKTLGIGRSGFEPMFALRWKPGRHHELQVGYLFVNRTGENTLQDSVRFEDTVFSAGLKLNSKFNADYAFLAYRFAIMAKQNTQLGLNLALGYINFQTSITAKAGVGGPNDTLTADYGVSKNFPGPVATLGLFGRFRFSPKWYLETDGAYLTGSSSGVTVKEFVIGAAARYFLSRKIGLEAGYGITGVDVNIATTGNGAFGSVNGKIKYSFQNLRLGAILAL